MPRLRRLPEQSDDYPVGPNRPRPHTLLPLLVLLALSPWAPNTALGAPERIALVIGNAAYTGHAPLVNTLADARDMSAKLRDLGFTVTTVENADQRRLGRVVSKFLRHLRGSEERLGIVRRNIGKNLPCGSDGFIEALEQLAGRILRFRPGNHSACILPIDIQCVILAHVALRKLIFNYNQQVT